MCSVRRTKGIAYVIVCQVSQLFAELFTVLGLLFAAETGILKKHDVTLAHSLHSLGSSLAGHIVIRHKIYFLAQLLRQSLGNRSQRLTLVRAVLYLS